MSRQSMQAEQERAAQKKRHALYMRDRRRGRETAALKAQVPPASGVVRVFTTGANRDLDMGKFDYEGFLSPEVLEAFAAYMHKNRVLKDGAMRDSDNWQKGIPPSVYVKSLLRHVMAVWKARRAGELDHVIDEMCGVLFNIQGLLFETLKGLRKVKELTQ